MSTTGQRGTTAQTEQNPPAPAPSSLLGRALAVTAPAPSGHRGSTLLRHLIVAVVLVAVLIGVTYVLPQFQDYQLATVLAYLCATAGLTVLVGLNGQISLGHAAIMAVGGYTTAFVQNGLVSAGFTATQKSVFGTPIEIPAGWTIWVSLLVGMFASIVAGLLIGLAAARLRGPYLAGVTLAVGVIVPGITTTFDVFNGDQGVAVKTPPKPASLGASFPVERWQAWVGIVIGAVVMLLLANVITSRYGRSFRAVRDDEVAAQLSGISVARTQIIAFVVSCAAAGLGGSLFVFLVRNAQPGLFSLNLSIYLILAIVLGGLGSLAGAVWGALFIVYVPYLLERLGESISAGPATEQRLTGNLPLAIFGLALILVTILAPGGIQNLVRRIGRWLRGLTRRPASE